MSQYLIEVKPGRELLYRTPLLLRAAIRTGEITADSRVFHRATSTWISITEHPEYRKIQAELHPPPWLDPPLPPESVALPAAPKEHGVFRGLTETGVALAASGWASLRKRFDSYRTKTARSPIPAKPPRTARSQAPARSSKPAPSAQPGQPTKPTERQDPEPTRNRWTFYP